MSMKSAILAAGVFLCGNLLAQNLLTNPRFEHNEASYAIQAYQCPIKDIGLRFVPYEKGNALEFKLYPITAEGIRMPEFLMQPDVEYEFSGMLKESQLVGAGVNIFKIENEAVGLIWEGDPFKVEKINEWTPFCYRFKNDKKTPSWQAFTFGSWLTEEAAKNMGGTIPVISIADLYLGPAGKRDSAQEDKFSVSMQIKDDPIALTFEPGAKLKFSLHFLNKTDAGKDCLVKLNVMEMREGKFTPSIERSFAIQPGESLREIDLTAPSSNGIYKFTGNVDGKDFVNAVKICVSPKIRVKKGELPIDLGTNGFISSTANTPISQEEVNLFADAGFAYIRAWGQGLDSFVWDRMEPEDGKFEWTLADRQLDLMEKAGLEIIPVVGSDFLRQPDDYPTKKDSRHYHNLPPWLVDISPVAREFTFPAWKGCKTILPPLDKFERMVKAFGERYRGRIHVWEILNENSIYMTPAEYKPYLRISYETLKGIDSSNTVIGGGLTGDFGFDMNDGLKAQIHEGVFKYADGVVYHPYRGLYEDSSKSSDSMFDHFRGELKKSNLNIPLWNTEVYYLAPSSNGGDDAAARHFHPGYLARRYLVDAAQGAMCATLLNGDAFLGNMINDNFQGDHPGVFFASRLLPNEKYIVSAVFAKTFKGTKFADKLKTPDDFLFYKFAGKERAVASLYALNVKERDSRKLPLSAAKKSFPEIQILDVFGNPLKEEIIKASPIPIYISAPSMEALDGFITAITGASETFVVLGDAMRIVPEDGNFVALIPMKNCKASEIHGQLELLSKGRPCAKTFDFTLSASEESLLKIPLSQTGGALDAASAKVLVGGKSFEFPLNVAPAGKSLRLGTEVHLGNLTFKATCAGKTLKLSFDVKDATASGAPNGRNPWEQDCIEIFLDAQPSQIGMKDLGEYTDKVARLFIMPYENEGKRLLAWPGKLNFQGVKETISLKVDGYSAELEIPLETLALPAYPNGTCIGFDVKLDDAKGQGKADSKEHWNSSGDACKNRLSFGYIAF